MSYRGRFAPSPTGPLHFGSLVAAMGSYADARAHRGEWLLRIEDIDPPREQRGAIDLILGSLDRYGFRADGETVLQSRLRAAHEAALEALRARGLLFACACTRRELLQALLGAGGERIYPGTCRDLGLPISAQYAWRVSVPEREIVFTDLLQGPQRQHLARDVGDFVVRRADGLIAYQIAVVVDDAAEGITHVVRGSDLLSSTARQIWLQQALGLPTPAYLHLPVAINPAGEKLSKQSRARPLSHEAVLPTLRAAWSFLDQAPPPPVIATAAEFWDWAAEHWSRSRLPPVLLLPAPPGEGARQKNL
jgi:glutamyl-Q tRNA(Asp) synthetase